MARQRSTSRDKKRSRSKDKKARGARVARGHAQLTDAMEHRKHPLTANFW
jgi:hypothetical protein